jgi:hypothetical protein
VLEPARIADVLSGGSPEYASIELVRASLDAGSSDNVTCIVADVLTEEQAAEQPPLEPQVVGAAAELKRRLPRTLFRGHRSGDTGELEPVQAEIPDGVDFAIRADPPVDPETYRYAPRPPARYAWTKRILALVVVLGLVWVALASAYWWTQRQYYVGDHDGHVAIYRGIPGVPGLSTVYKESDVPVAPLEPGLQNELDDGISVDDYDQAKDRVAMYARQAQNAEGSSE